MSITAFATKNRADFLHRFHPPWLDRIRARGLRAGCFAYLFTVGQLLVGQIRNGKLE